MNETMIKLNWKNVGTGVTRAIVESSSCLIRSRIITASSSYHNCDISNGLKTTMFVNYWNTNQWGDIE